MMLLGTIPNPPLDMRTPATTDAIFSTVSVLLAVAAVAYALVLWKRERTVIPALIVLGGGCAALIEPIVDVNGGCWWPRHGGWVAFHLFGTPVPIWAVALAQVAGIAVFGLAGLFYWTMSHLLFPEPARSAPPAARDRTDAPAPLSVGA